MNFPDSGRIFFPSLSLALLLLQYCQKRLNPRDLLKELLTNGTLNLWNSLDTVCSDKYLKIFHG